MEQFNTDEDYRMIDVKVSHDHRSEVTSDYRIDPKFEDDVKNFLQDLAIKSIAQKDDDDKLFTDCPYDDYNCTHDDYETMCDECRGDMTADRADMRNDLD